MHLRQTGRQGTYKKDSGRSIASFGHAWRGTNRTWSGMRSPGRIDAFRFFVIFFVLLLAGVRNKITQLRVMRPYAVLHRGGLIKWDTTTTATNRLETFSKKEHQAVMDRRWGADRSGRGWRNRIPPAGAVVHTRGLTRDGQSRFEGGGKHGWRLDAVMEDIPSTGGWRSGTVVDPPRVPMMNVEDQFTVSRVK